MISAYCNGRKYRAGGNFAHEAFFAGFSILTVLLNSLGSLEMQDSIKCGRPEDTKRFRLLR